MLSLVCHPENAEWMMDERQRFGYRDMNGGYMRIVTSKFMPIDRPTGKYVHPDGRVLLPDEIEFSTPFIDYGPEDLSWLLYVDIFKVYRERVGLMMNEQELRIQLEKHNADGPKQVPTGLG